MINYNDLAVEIADEIYPVDETKDINKYENAKEAIHKNLKNMCKMFTNLQHPFSEFPIDKFEENERYNFIKVLYKKIHEYKEKDSANRQIIDNLSKYCINIDLRFLWTIYDTEQSLSWENIVKKIKDEANKCNFVYKDENGHEQLVNFIQNNARTPISKDMIDILNFYFQDNKDVAAIIEGNEEYNLFHPFFFEERMILTERYNEIIDKLYRRYKYIYRLYDLEKSSQYDLRDFVFNYYDFIIESFMWFCQIFILQNELISKEAIRKKRTDMLDSIYKKITNISELNFADAKIQSQTDDIFKAFSIFITYFINNAHTNENNEIYSFLLDKSNNQKHFEPIKEGYRCDYRNINSNIEKVKQTIKEDPNVSSNEVEKIFIDTLEDFITEGEGISGFKIKFEETQEFIRLFNDFLGREGNYKHLYELKVFFRAIFYKYDCKAINEHLHKNLKDKSNTTIRTPIIIMRSYMNKLKEQNNVKKFSKEQFNRLYKKKKIQISSFQNTTEYRFITALLTCGNYREAERLDEYIIFHKINKYLTESLQKIFFSFDYNVIMENLYKISKILTKILLEEFKSILLTD